MVSIIAVITIIVGSIIIMSYDYEAEQVMFLTVSIKGLNQK